MVEKETKKTKKTTKTNKTKNEENSKVKSASQKNYKRGNPRADKKSFSGSAGGGRNNRGGKGKFGEKEKKDVESQTLDLARVVKVTGGGKQLHFRAVVVSGDKNGKIGVGVRKGRDVAQAIDKATRDSQKNMIQIPFSQETIPHEVMAKYGSAVVLLRPQEKGRGVVAGGVVRVICNLSGIKNISSKLISRSRNKLNIARATVLALKNLKSNKKQQ